MGKFGKMSSTNKAANELGDRLDKIIERREALEAKLFKAQEKLGDINRQKNPAAWEKALVPVNELKQQISEIAVEHVDVAHAFSIVSGGKIIRPPQIIPAGVGGNGG